MTECRLSKILVSVYRVKDNDMSNKRLKIMDFDKFQSIADEFIHRSSQEFGEMPASAFFELLLDKLNVNPGQLGPKTK